MKRTCILPLPAFGGFVATAEPIRDTDGPLDDLVLRAGDLLGGAATWTSAMRACRQRGRALDGVHRRTRNGYTEGRFPTVSWNLLLWSRLNWLVEADRKGSRGCGLR
jgi:hypothetical protein